MIEAARLSKEAFERIRDIDFDILRWHAAIEGRHHHFGEIDGWKQIDRHAYVRINANHRQRQTYDNYEIGAADGKTRHLVLFVRALILYEIDHPRLDALSGTQAAAVADYHGFALSKAGDHFRIGRGLNASHNPPLFDFV